MKIHLRRQNVFLLYFLAVFATALYCVCEGSIRRSADTRWRNLKDIDLSKMFSVSMKSAIRNRFVSKFEKAGKTPTDFQPTNTVLQTKESVPCKVCGWGRSVEGGLSLIRWFATIFGWQKSTKKRQFQSRAKIRGIDYCNFFCPNSSH